MVVLNSSVQIIVSPKFFGSKLEVHYWLPFFTHTVYRRLVFYDGYSCVLNIYTLCVEKVGFPWISFIFKYNLTLITLVLKNKF